MKDKDIINDISIHIIFAIIYVVELGIFVMFCINDVSKTSFGEGYIIILLTNATVLAFVILGTVFLHIYIYEENQIECFGDMMILQRLCNIKSTKGAGSKKIMLDIAYNCNQYSWLSMSYLI